ncbi:MAG: NAD-dependent malic enzyme, partial [Eubacteriales bacterium]|nr:NAD-dependent malic enzyme [Eubacteriales bacterium]
DIDAVPICLDTQDTEEIINIVKNMSATFGGINLEDISAPRCFEIERRLQELLPIPVFHDDQHGTAVVVSAALINACKVTGRNLTDIRVLVSGDGAAGTAITRMLYSLGIRDILVCGIDGILSTELTLNEVQKALLEITNSNNISGSMAEGLCGRDVFIGVSAPGILTEDMIKTMADKPIVFAMANPEPEIMPQLAKNAGTAVVGTGRSDFGNQINNVMAFPGIFRGALDAKAERITEEMKVAAAYALADFVGESRLSADRILPDAFEDGIAAAVAGAVADAWRNR